MLTLMPRLLRTLAPLACVIVLDACFCRGSGQDPCEDPKEQQLVAQSVTAVVDPLRLNVLPGGSVTASVNITIGGGATGAVLSVMGPLPSGVSASFTPATLSASGTSTLTLSAATTATPGLSVFAVRVSSTGPGTSISTDQQLTAQVMQPFTMSASSATVTVGSSVDVSIGLSRASGFTGGVALTADSASLPANTKASFDLPVVSGASATMRLVVPTNATPGRYLARVVGSTGASADTARFLLTVVDVPVPPDITILATPATVAIAPGGRAAYDIAMTRSAPGLGDIVLTATGLPTGATAALSPATVTGTTSRLDITTTTATPDGTYPISISATAGTLVRTQVVTLSVVTPADFTMSASPSALTVARGASGSTNVALQRTGSPGSIALEVLGMPAGVTGAFTPANATGTTSSLTLSVASTTATGVYPLTVRGVAGTIARTTTVTLTVPAPPPPANTLAVEVLTPSVTIAPRATALIPVRITRSGSYVGQLIELRLTGGVTGGGSAWIAPTWVSGDTATLQVIGGTVGTSTLRVTALAGITPPSATATINVVASSTADFSLLPQQTELTIVKGEPPTPPTIKVDVLRANGFAGTLAYDAVLANPRDFTIAFLPGEPSPLNSTTMQITANASAAVGKHVVVVRGRSGGLTRTAAVTIIVEEPYYYGGYRRRPPEER